MIEQSTTRANTNKMALRALQDQRLPASLGSHKVTLMRMNEPANVRDLALVSPVGVQLLSPVWLFQSCAGLYGGVRIRWVRGRSARILLPQLLDDSGHGAPRFTGYEGGPLLLHMRWCYRPELAVTLKFRRSCWRALNNASVPPDRWTSWSW